MAQADVSIEALVDFSERLASVRTHASEEIDSFKRIVRRSLSDAEHIVADRQQDHAAAIAALNAVDEEESDYAERKAVELAEVRLFKAQRHLSDVNAAATNFLAKLSDSASHLQGRFLAASEFLDQRIQTASRYRSIAAPGDTDSARAVSHSRMAVPRENNKAQSTDFSLAGASRTALPELPGRLQWVPLDEIDLTLIPNDLAFEKASKREMLEMMAVFERTVVPALHNATNPFSVLEELQKLNDEKRNSKSAAFAYECMLGSFGASDVVAVDRLSGGGHGKRGITSGRHRIALAVELGWSHVPARILGER